MGEWTHERTFIFLFIKEGNQFLPQEFAQFDTQYNLNTLEYGSFVNE